jgi:leucyl-tRNA synthetase
MPPPPPESARDIPPHRYSAALASEIESRWQERWQREDIYRAPNPGEPGFDPAQPKLFVLDMFPYPSGAGLHVGHPLGYIATDIYARYKRMSGFNVLHAMGFDAFGLPAEQYAIDTGTHPRTTTEKNIQTFKKQLRRLGLGHEERRGVATTDVAFYKWTQWIFLQVYNSWYDAALNKARPISELVAELESGKRTTGPQSKPWAKMDANERAAFIGSNRLAYLADVDVNWCPALGTVLANEEVTTDGRSERGNHPVLKRPLRQWMMRITAYTDRLLGDLESVDWPEPIKIMQRNWIGRSEGAFVDFASGTRKARVFTTRADTLYGATYMVLSPEHALVDALALDKWGPTVPDAWKGRFPGAEELIAKGATPKEMIAAYRAFASKKTDEERQADAKEKTGVFIGAYAVNPANDERIPIFIADYVLMGYGSGAMMAVPAHDARDFEFAKQFGLPIRDVYYSKTILAMSYFCKSATERERKGEGWFPLLADFMGVVTTCDLKPSDYAAALKDVREKPRNPEDDLKAKRAEKRQAHEDVPGALGRRRGTIRVTWQETLENMGFDSFGELCDWFSTATFHAHAGEAFSGDGIAVNSGPLDGLTTEDAKTRIVEIIESKGFGRRALQHKLRDWLFSRQRYWGEPFPIVYEEGDAHHERPIALPEKFLPVTLPEIDEYKPVAGDDPTAPPQPPLGRAKEWGAVELDLGDGPKRYRRELNTMPQWAGSCWYYLRYLDPENPNAFVSPESERYWMLSGKGRSDEATEGKGGKAKFDGARHHSGGVDLYVGGAEHAVLHLLYARFWHKVLFDLGHVSTPEPFGRLFNQGYIQAPAYIDERGVYVDASAVVENPPGAFTFEGGAVKREFGKMGKSLKNVITPDDVCDEYGADTMRLYEMYMGPLEQSKPWNPRDIVGVHRFLQRVWRTMIDEETGVLSVSDEAPDAETRRLLHKTIESVRSDFESLSFNTSIAKLIELNNHVGKAYSGGPTPREVARTMALLLAPIAPHFAEELWSRLHAGNTGSIVREAFPVADASLLIESSIELPVQVQGKVRGRIVVSAQADEATIRAAALEEEKVKAFLEGKTVQKVIVVPGRMVNIVAA